MKHETKDICFSPLDMLHQVDTSVHSEIAKQGIEFIYPGEHNVHKP